MQAHGGSWVDHLVHAKKTINDSVHQTMGFPSGDMWEDGGELRTKGKQ